MPCFVRHVWFVAPDKVPATARLASTAPPASAETGEEGTAAKPENKSAKTAQKGMRKRRGDHIESIFIQKCRRHKAPALTGYYIWVLGPNVNGFVGADIAK